MGCSDPEHPPSDSPTETSKAFHFGVSQLPVEPPRLKPTTFLGNVLETPTPTTCLKSTAVHLQFVRQYAPHLYRRAFLASKLRRKGNPSVRLPFVLQYASHLYGSTPPICTAVLWKNTGGWGHRNVSEFYEWVISGSMGQFWDSFFSWKPFCSLLLPVRVSAQVSLGGFRLPTSGLVFPELTANTFKG